MPFGSILASLFTFRLEKEKMSRLARYATELGFNQVTVHKTDLTKDINNLGDHYKLFFSSGSSSRRICY